MLCAGHHPNTSTMAFELTVPASATNLAGTGVGQMTPKELWAAGIEMYANTEDCFKEMESSRPDAIIRVAEDTSKGAGQKVTFQVQAELHDEPHEGDELFEEADDFENLVFNDFSLTVDFLRHSVRYNKRLCPKMGISSELKLGIPRLLGNWLGRIKGERMAMMFLNQINAENIVNAGSKTKDTLVSADTLAWDEVVALKTQMGRQGGNPAYVGMQGKNPLHRYAILGTTDGLFSLETDPDYKSMLEQADDRGNSNYLFTGGFKDIRGCVIKEFNPKDHDGQGAIGSPFNPKATLGVAMVAGGVTGSTSVIKGGGNATAAAITKKKYFKYFENYAYRFNVDTTLAQDADTHYVMIINPPNAPTDPNKFGFYAYTTGNNGNQITPTAALYSSASGIGLTTVGGLTWDSNVNTVTHPVGALIVQCNRLGTAIGYSLALGAGAAYRGYGEYRGDRTEQEHNGGFVKEVYMTSVFGQTPRKDVLDRCPGVMVLRHAITYAGITQPTIS